MGVSSNLSDTQGEVVDFAAKLIFYFRGDFEKASEYMGRIRKLRTQSLVRNDAAILAGISQVRRGLRIDELQKAHEQNRYSRFAVQALVMGNIVEADRNANTRQPRLTAANQLVSSYRHLFEPNDPWLAGADSYLRLFR